MNKQQTIDLLKQQMPSFYSLEQVIEMISKIDEPKSSILDDELIERIVDKTKRTVKNIIGNIDFDDCDYELEMDYNNTITLTNVDIDSEGIANDVGIELEDFLDSIKEEFETKTEEAQERPYIVEFPY
jgi:hypothetical protein